MADLILWLVQYGPLGVLVLSLGVLGLVVYLFVMFLTNHMGKVTSILDDLVQVTRAMREEFYRLVVEIRDHGRDHERR